MIIFARDMICWSWGHSRLIDYLQGTDYADMEHIVATGHSRGGKVALCAGIFDERIAMVAANGSGCGGLGCFRFAGSRIGEGHGKCEMTGSMYDWFPFWWGDRLGQFGARTTDVTRDTLDFNRDMSKMFASMDFSKIGCTGDEEYLPFDLHFLRALIAPRAVISTDGLSDTWSNPFGTQITWIAADEVFAFLGAKGRNALHFREGGHDHKATDWEAVLDFCEHVFRGKPMTTDTFIMASSDPDPSDQMAMMAAALGDWRDEKVHFDWRKPE